MSKQFIVHAAYDPEAKMWVGSNDELPLTTEAGTLDDLFDRVMEIAPEIATLNGLVTAGEKVEIQLTADRVTVAA
jgi:hypothetical protein